MRRNAFLLIASLTLLVSAAEYGTRTSQAGQPAIARVAQSPVGRGRFLSPARSAAHQASIPFAIRWELDIQADVDSQDLILSTDGGTTFNIKIAAHLPPEQHQLIWSASRGNVTVRAKLEIVLRLKNRQIVEVIGDDFSILPEPSNVLQAAKVAAASLGIATGSGSVEPAFAGTGACVTGTLPTLDFNMHHPTQCSTNYSGEPALAQDPNDPSRFHTTTGNSIRIKSTGVNYGFSGTSKTKFLDFAGLGSRGDLTTEIGIDGTVYAVGLGQSSGVSSPDQVMIFRSTDDGVTFAPGVAIPKPPGIALVDKPVIAVHPTNAQILAITFQEQDGVSLLRTWLGICKASPAGTLSASTNWVFVQPVDSGGSTLKGWLSVHPLIDPVISGSPFYWLFIVFTNNDFSGGCCRGPAGISVFKYQVNNLTQAIENGGFPVQALFQPLGYNLWDKHPTNRKVELALRMLDPNSNKNLTKAAIDYCDPNAHRMYIPTLVNTTGALADGLTSDLFVTVWQYTGTPSPQCPSGICTTRILPDEKEKYVACAVTDGHGRVWINAFMTAQNPNNPGNNDNNRAQMGAVAIDRITGAPGAIAYMSLRLPLNLSYVFVTDFFLGDYIYTQGTFYSGKGGSRIAMPTYTDLVSFGCSPASRDFDVSISGWF
jgi:hypothetical protein